MTVPTLMIVAVLITMCIFIMGMIMIGLLNLAFLTFSDE
jgi:hypothetical protein